MIPLVDLKANFASIEAEVLEGMKRVMSSAAFILGPDVTEFEKEYAAFVGAKHCVGVANGTDALELLVRAAGLRGTDEVLVPANSFIASALGVQRAGATVRFVDCDDDGLIDVSACEVTKNVKAILPVHLYGQCAAMEQVEAFAASHGLLIIEDAAQAQGARRNGRSAGSWGFGAGTSFYPGKNLGAYGDGGAITTNDDATAKKLRALRNYGSEVKYLHPEVGFNSRLDTLQAVVLRAKLKRLPEWNALRRAAAERYASLLNGLKDVQLPRVAVGNEHIWHLYAVRVPASVRDAVMKAMQAAGVGVGVHYPIPIHKQGAFASHAHQALPHAEAQAAQMISLPMYPEISAAQQAQVADALTRAMASA